MYEESTGEERIMIGMWLRDFEKKLDTGDRNIIIDARKELKSKVKQLKYLIAEFVSECCLSQTCKNGYFCIKNSIEVRKKCLNS